MTRIVVFNHLPMRSATRSIGRFRATASVRDHHDDCGCGCGGKGDCNHSHDDAGEFHVTLVSRTGGKTKSVIIKASSEEEALATARRQNPAGSFYKVDTGKGATRANDASPLETAKQNYLRQSELLTKAHKEVRELTANRQKTSALVNEVYNRYDRVKRDFEAAKQELDRLERSSQRDGKNGDYTTAELGIDVIWTKGGYDRPKITESRHYSIPEVAVDPRGYAPSGAFVAEQLRRHPGYREMTQSGWTLGKVEGYYKREQRDVGRMV
jgi:hypothetical protein